MERPSFIENGMRQWRIVLTVVALLATFGVYSFFTMQRQEFPDFTVRQGLVIGVMPGATSREVEEQVARPVEDYLFSFNEVNKKKTYAVSKDGKLVVYVELNGAIKGLEAPAFWAKLRHGLNELKAQKLPSQVLALIGSNDFGDTSAVLFTLVAEGRSPRDLQKYLEVLQAHLRRIDATTKLRTFGTQQEVIRVGLSLDRLARYGVRPATVWAALQGLGSAPAPARLDGEEIERPIYLRKVLRSESELAETIILSLPTGQHVRLKDVAEIRREYGHDDAFVRFNGKTALVLSIEMQSGNDITRFGDEVDRAVAAARRELPPGVSISRVADQPRVVRTSINHFLRDFGLAIASVILVTMLLLPLRVASVAAITIPISVAITLGILNLMGVQLQTVSLAGLVVVLGMIVDNAIVIIDDHVDRLDRGMDPWTAAWRSARELTVPVLVATVAIILSYVPLPLFLTGLAADFIGSLPVTIAVALVASLLVSVLLVPVMNSQFIRRGLHRNGDRRSLLDLLQGGFDRALQAAFRHPWPTIAVGVGSVVVAGLLGARIPQQMLPKIDRNQFAVEVYLPSGRSLKQTDQVIRQLEKELLADKRVVNVTSFVGQSSPRFHTVYAPHMPARNFGQLLVNTTDAEATVAVLRDSERRLRGAFPEAHVRWKQLEFLFGFPVEIRLTGDDITTLKRTAARIEAYARSIPGTTWVHDDYEEPLQAVEVIPDTDACARLGIPPAMLQASLALGSQGFPVATIWEGDYPVRVLVKDEPRSAAHLEGLRQQTVSSLLAGAAVPLEQIASLRPAWHEGAIVRRNGVYTLTVNIALGMSALGSEVQKQVEGFIAKLDTPGVRVSYGGEKELAEEVMIPMAVSMLASIGLIFLTVLVQFQRFRKALLVMAAMPLTLFGAFAGLVMMDYPFGVTAFVGVIGLMGIVVRNGIILITYAEELRCRQGLSAMEAGLAAGKRRMRPIYLTSMAAAIGVVPLILSRSTLWGPLGTVTCFGLLFAMVLTLFVLPVAYGLVMGRQDKGSSRTAQAAAVVGLAVMLLLQPSVAQAQQQPLTLAAAKAMALRRNADVEESKLEVEAAQETRKAAYTKYFPQVSGTVAGMVAWKPLAQIHMEGGNLPVFDGNPANLATATQFAYFPGGDIGIADKAFIASLTAVQPVYAGGRVLNGNRLAKLGVEVAMDKAAIARRDVLVQTEDKYWRLIALGEKRKTLITYQSLLAALDEQVSDGLAAGLLTRNDQLKVRLKRAEAAVDRLRLEDGLRLATRDLRQHIGLPPSNSLTLADALSLPEDPARLRREREGALDRRPEVRLLSSAVRAEQLQAALKRGEMLPNVSIGASLLRFDVQGMPGATNALLFGMVSVPLSGIWEGVHNVAAHRKRTELAEKKLSNVRELLGIEIDKTWADFEAAWQSAKVAESAIEQAEVNVKENEDRHRSGLVTFSDVLEAHVLRQQAFDKRVDARADYWSKRSAYLRAVARER